MSTSNSSKKKPIGKTHKNKARRRMELIEILSGSSWFMFFKDFLYVMTLQEAVFLQDLVNNYNMADDSDVDDDGYFRCTMSYLNFPPMNWTEDLQKKLIKSLEEKGFVERKISKTTPPQRWIRINIEKVIDEIGQIKGENRPKRRKTWKNSK